MKKTDIIVDKHRNPDDYIRSAVKIEAGAKSALDPNEATAITPYVSDDLP